MLWGKGVLEDIIENFIDQWIVTSFWWWVNIWFFVGKIFKNRFWMGVWFRLLGIIANEIRLYTWTFCWKDPKLAIITKKWCYPSLIKRLRRHLTVDRLADKHFCSTNMSTYKHIRYQSNIGQLTSYFNELRKPFFCANKVTLSVIVGLLFIASYNNLSIFHRVSTFNWYSK